MYELYLNGNKVKQINYIGEHDYTPVVEQVETPLITNNDEQYAEGDCNVGRPMGAASVQINCDTVGATIYYRYGLCTVDEYCNPTLPDLTNEPWVVFDSLSIQNTGTNVCDDGTQWWYVEAYATKSGMEDSSVGSSAIMISDDEYIDCNDCNNWEECGYTSWDDCYITNNDVFPTPTVTGGIDANVSSTMSNITMLAYGVENLEWKVDYGYSIDHNYVTNWTAGSYVSGSGANSLYSYTRNDPWTDVDGYAHIKVTMRRDGVESETYHYEFNQVEIIDVTE